MAARDTDGARVDVCAACGGLWLDWFDGDPVRLARRVPKARVVQEGDSTEGRCPRCRVPLEAEEFREAGPRVYRCGVCFGLLIPGDAVELIAALNPASDAPAEEPGSLWTALAAIMRRIAG